MTAGLFDEPVDQQRHDGTRAESVAKAAVERRDDELAFWKGKAQIWAVELADERLKVKRLWAIVKRLRRVRAAGTAA
jgi:hypothetical protein